MAAGPTVPAASHGESTDGNNAAQSLLPPAKARYSGIHCSATESKYPVHDASERSVTFAPLSQNVRKSCARRIDAARSSTAGSWSAIQASLAMVKAAVGVEPIRRNHFSAP